MMIGKTFYLIKFLNVLTQPSGHRLKKFYPFYGPSITTVPNRNFSLALALFVLARH
jgi:hypothetical protein